MNAINFQWYFGLPRQILSFQDINDNEPLCPKHNQFVIPENNIPGAVVGHFKGIDGDSGPNGTLSYELLNDSERMFNIDPQTGIVPFHLTYKSTAIEFSFSGEILLIVPQLLRCGSEFY